MAMEVDRLTVKVDTDFRGLTSGLQSATRQVQGFKKEIEGTQAQLGKGGDFPVRTDTKQVDTAQSKVGALFQEINKGGTLEVRADDSQLSGVSGLLDRIRADIANSPTYKINVDQSGFTAANQAANATRANVENGGTFKVLADVSGIEGAATQIEYVKGQAADSPTFVVRSDTSGILQTEHALEQVREKANQVNGQDVKVDVDTSQVDAAAIGLEGFAQRIRDIGEVVSVAKIPVLMAGIGAIPAVATAATAGIAALAGGLGTGLVGAAGTAGVAMGLAQAGIAATSQVAISAVSSVLGLGKGMFDLSVASKAAEKEVKAFQELVDAMPAGTEASVQAQQRLALAQEYQTEVTQMQIDWWSKFGESANTMAGHLNTLRLGILQTASDAAGSLIPTLDEFVQIGISQLPAINTAFDGLAQGIAEGTAELIRFLNSSQGMEAVSSVITAIGDAAAMTVNILSNLGIVLLQAVQPVIPEALNLLSTLSQLSRAASEWAVSAEGTQTIGDIWSVLSDYADQLYTAVSNLATGFYNLAEAVGASGLVEQMMSGFVGLTEEFNNLTTAGTESRAAIDSFLSASGPVLSALGGLAATVAIEFFKMADAVIHATNPETGGNSLVELIDALNEAVPPLAEILTQTFIDLAPALTDAVGPLSEFMATFLGSSGVLITVVETLGTAADIFNNLPDWVKSAAVEVAAFSVASSAMGGPTLGGAVTGVANLATGMYQISVLRGISTNLAALQTGAAGAGAASATGAVGVWGLVASLAALALVGAIVIDVVVHLPEMAAAFEEKYTEAREGGAGISRAIVEGFNSAIDQTTILSWVGALGDAIDSALTTLNPVSLWDVLTGQASLQESADAGGIAAPIILALQDAYTATTDWLAGLAPEVSLWDVLVGNATLQEGVEGGSPAATIIASLGEAWTAVNEWIAGLAPEITLMDVIMGGATLEEATAEGGLAAIMISALSTAWTAVSEWIAGLAPEVTLMDVIMGGATMEEATAEGGLAAQLIAALEPAWTAVSEWIAGLAPEITLMDVIMGNATMEEAAGSGNIAAQTIEILQGAWDSIMEWLGGLVPDISLADIILGVENVAAAVGEFIAVLSESFISGLATITQAVTDFFTVLYNDYWLYYFGADGVLITGILDFFTVLYNDYWLYYFGADGVLVTGLLDFFTVLYNDYWLYYFGPDGLLITGILDFFTILYNDYWLYYFGPDGILITGILDFFTILYNDYWLYYFGPDGILITGILDFFTVLYNDYWLYYFGPDGVLITGILDFFTVLYNDYWLYYFGPDGVLITGILDFFTVLYNDYWLYYFGPDGALITPIVDFFTTLYNDYFLYYLGPDGVVVTAVADAWAAILAAIPEFVRGFGNLLGQGLADGINKGIGYLQGLLNAIDAVLTAIDVSPLGVTLPTVSFEGFAEGGSTESMAAGGSRGGAGSRGKQPRHIVWNEGMGEEYWIATGPAADKRKNVGWLAKAASKLGLGVVPMQAGGVIGSGGRLAGIGRTEERYLFTYLAREFPDETTATDRATTPARASTAGAAGALGAAGTKKLSKKQKRRARRRERRGVGTTTGTGLTGTTPTSGAGIAPTSGATPTSRATTPTTGMPTTTPVTPTATGTMPTSGFPARGAVGGMRRPRSRTDGRARNQRSRGRERARGRGHRRNRRAMGGDTSGLIPTLYMQDGGFAHVGAAGLSGHAYDIATEIANQFGVYPNTYLDGPLGPHGGLHGNSPENTFDFWGPGGPGDPIDPGTAEAIRQYLYDNYGSELDTVIWNGQGEGPGGIFPDEGHYDHLHASIGGGGLMNSAGVLASALLSKMKGIWDSAMSALGDPLLGEGALWDGIETYLATLPAMAWAWLKTKVPRGTGTAVLRGLGPAGSALELAEQAIQAVGWPASELAALEKLWGEESGWDANAINPQSGAYGIPQIDPGSWGIPVPLGDEAAQIEWGINYIAEQYGTPSAALDWWLANNSYARGGVVPGASPQAAVVHGGERVLPQNINRGFENLAQAVDRWDGETASGMGGAGANSEAEAVLEEILVEIKRGNDSPTPVDINNMSDMQRSFVTGFMAGIDSDVTTEKLDQKMAEGVRFASTLGGL